MAWKRGIKEGISFLLVYIIYFTIVLAIIGINRKLPLYHPSMDMIIIGFALVCFLIVFIFVPPKKVLEKKGE